MKQKNWGQIALFVIVVAVFAVFLAEPALRLFWNSFAGEGGITFSFYQTVFSGKSFHTALGNSFCVSAAAAVLAVIIAFGLAYTLHFTNLPQGVKNCLQRLATVPMLLPTITYGFAIIYSFGKQGLITQLLGFQLFPIYGFWGVLVGYAIYTIPTAFLLISNTMTFLDKKFLLVSRTMGDSPVRSLWIAVLRPLMGTFAGAFIQAFFLCFTDFGIPASVGGKYEVIATLLYNRMLGGVPDFHRGAVIAVIMFLPSIGSILLMRYLDKYNIRYNGVGAVQLRKGNLRDGIFGISSFGLVIGMICVFAVILVAPMVKNWPYQMELTGESFRKVFQDGNLMNVYLRSVVAALLTAGVGTLLAYMAALVTQRSRLPGWCRQTVEGIALVTNSIPGMVLGIGFLFSFAGTPLQNTLGLVVICNVVHYFSTPYLMMKNALQKLDAGLETTAMLLGDTWLRAVARVITPNVASGLAETFGYYFVNSMITVSALIFLVGSRTMVLTAKIKQLQYTNQFNEVFVLSLLILATNLIAKAVFGALTKKLERKVTLPEERP